VVRADAVDAVRAAVSVGYPRAHPDFATKIRGACLSRGRRRSIVYWFAQCESGVVSMCRLVDCLPAPLGRFNVLS